VAYANSYGAHGHRIKSAAEFTQVVSAAFAAGGVHLIDCPVDYSMNRKLLIDDLRKNHQLQARH
jgi:acetolactate synthase-1/2/3 large subunit